MSPSNICKVLLVCVVFALIQYSNQLELFEDAVLLENSDPIIESNLYSPAEENEIPGETIVKRDNMPYEPQGSNSENDNGNRVPDEQAQEEYLYPEPELYTPNRKSIDEETKTNMEQEYNQPEDTEETPPAPADTMALLNERPEDEPGTMPEQQVLYPSGDKKEDIHDTEGDEMDAKAEHDSKDLQNKQKEDKEGLNAEDIMNSKERKPNNDHHDKDNNEKELEKEVVHVEKHDSEQSSIKNENKHYHALEESVEKPKQTQKKSKDISHNNTEEHKHTFEELFHKNPEDNDINKNKDASPSENVEHHENVESKYNKDTKSKSSVTDSIDEETGPESPYKLSAGELPPEMPSNSKLQEENDKDENAKSGTDSKNKQHLESSEMSLNKNVEANDKDLPDSTNKEQLPSSEAHENEPQDKLLSQKTLEERFQAAPPKEVHEVQKSSEKSLELEAPVPHESSKESELDHNVHLQTESHKVSQNSEEDNKLEEPHSESENDIHNKDLKNDFDQGSSSNFETGNYIPKEHHSSEKKSDSSQHRGKYFEELIKKEQEEKKNEDKHYESDLAKLENVDTEPKIHEEIHKEKQKGGLASLPNIKKTKHDENDLNTVVQKDFEHQNSMESQLNSKTNNKMEKSSNYDKKAKEIFTNDQNLEGIDLEGTNGTAFSDNVMGKTRRQHQHGGVDDLSGKYNKTLPSQIEMENPSTKKIDRHDDIAQDMEQASGDFTTSRHVISNGEMDNAESGDSEDEEALRKAEKLEQTTTTQITASKDSKSDKKKDDDTVQKAELIELASDVKPEDVAGDETKPQHDKNDVERKAEKIEQETESSGDDDSGSGEPLVIKEADDKGSDAVDGVKKGEPLVVVPEKDDASHSEEKGKTEHDNNTKVTKINLEDSESSEGGESEDGSALDDDDDTSGAERERRQAFTTEEEVNKAKAKLKNALGASDALTSIEREMGLDPAIAPSQTKNLTSALHNEINKFKDIISHQDDAVKRSKFHKLEKLAEEDVKGANDVMKLIVELEVAKFFAKDRARKKLELAMRNNIATPPAPAPPPAVSNYIQPYQDQGYTPYAPFPPPSIAPFSSFPQFPPSSNPLVGQFMDNMQPPQPQPAPYFAPPQNEPQDYSPYVGTPMNAGPQSMYPQHFSAYIPPAAQPKEDKAPHFAANEAAKPPQQKAEDLQDEVPKEKMEDTLPKSSPFAGLRPLTLSSFKPIQALPPQAPSFSSELRSQSSPFSSYTQDSLEASSLHPFSDQLSKPEPPKSHVKQFFPQTNWAPPPRIGYFKNSLSHLHLNHQQPSAASFKPENSKPGAPVKPQPPNLSNLVNSRAQPLTTHQYHPEPLFVPPLQNRIYEGNPAAPYSPPMYPQFQMPAPLETAVPPQQVTQFFPAPPPPPSMPFMAPMYQPQPPPPPIQFQNVQNQQDKEDDNPMDDSMFNDEQQPQDMQYQAPQAYPQQQSFNGYNSWPSPVNQYPGDGYPWPQPQAPFAQGYSTQQYEQQLVNPLLNSAITKLHDTSKAAEVVQRIENKIGLSPPAVNHIIDDVETETKREKSQVDKEVQDDENKIKNEKKLSDEVPDNENLKKKIEEEQKKLSDDIKREHIAKAKLETIKKIEKILTVIETAKYSALKRAKEHLLRLKSVKDPQIRKRSLEALERDLHDSEKRHLHRRNEINIWLKGSKNNINTSHFLEGKQKDDDETKKRKFNVFGSPSIPKLEIANFAAKLSANRSKKNEIQKPKKEKIGVVLMKKLLQRMDDLYDMQSKILTQLIKDHQKVQDEQRRMRKKRSLKKGNVLRHILRHHKRHKRHSKHHKH